MSLGGSLGCTMTERCASEPWLGLVWCRLEADAGAVVIYVSDETQTRHEAGSVWVEPRSVPRLQRGRAS